MPATIALPRPRSVASLLSRLAGVIAYRRKLGSGRKQVAALCRDHPHLARDVGFEVPPRLADLEEEIARQLRNGW